MPMYNLLEYSKNYGKTTGSLWHYYRDEPSNPFSFDSMSFKYKASITGDTYNVFLTIMEAIQFQILTMTQIKGVKTKLKLLFH